MEKSKEKYMEDARERYIVVKMDGTSETLVKRNFREVIDDVGDDGVWQITKLDFEEIE